jgi:hypothetical protein
MALAISALGGAVVWGTFTLVTAIWAGQPVARADCIRAAVNVAAGILVGVIVAWFLGPALAPMVPIAGLRDPHVVGFGLGAATWELAPFAFRLLRLRAAGYVKDKR